MPIPQQCPHGRWVSDGEDCPDCERAVRMSQVADYWRWQILDIACEVRWYGRTPTLEDVQHAIEVLTLTKRAMELGQ